MSGVCVCAVCMCVWYMHVCLMCMYGMCACMWCVYLHVCRMCVYHVYAHLNVLDVCVIHACDVWVMLCVHVCMMYMCVNVVGMSAMASLSRTEVSLWESVLSSNPVGS